MTPERAHVLGPLPVGWQGLQLGDVVERQAEQVDPKPGDTYREIGIRSHGKGIFHKEPVKGVALGNKRVFAVAANCLVFNIVFAWEGAVAVTSDDDRGMIASHRFPMYSAKAGVSDPQFLRRFFQTRLGVRLLGDASPGGAGRNRTLNQKFAAEIPVPVPPLGEQRKIAAILSSVDDAIKATQVVIDQLSVVRRATTAELLTRGLEARRAPPHAVTLGDLLAEIYRYPSYYGISYEREGVPEVRGELIHDDGTLEQDRSRFRFISPTTAARFPRTKLSSGDFVMSVRGTVGKVGMVEASLEGANMTANLIRLSPERSRVEPRYLKHSLLSDAFQERLQSSCSVTTIKTVQVPVLRSLPIVLFPMGEQIRIADVLDSVDARLRAEATSADQLAQTKRALLSALLLGQVRVTPDDEAA